MEYSVLLGCLIGILLMALNGRAAYEQLRQSRWQKIDGTVIRQYVETNFENKQTKRQPMYQGKVEYRYEYMGTTYSGTRIRGSYARHETDAKEAISQYSAGKPINVYIYTLRPDQSKLDPVVDFGYVYGFGGGAFIFFVCLGVFLF